MKNQTAVEWFFSALVEDANITHEDVMALVQEAKQMEKEQIEVAYDNGWANALKYDLAIEWGDEHIDVITPKKYYNEQYGK